MCCFLTYYGLYLWNNRVLAMFGFLHGLRLLLTSQKFCPKGIKIPGEGLPYESDGDARRLA